MAYHVNPGHEHKSIDMCIGNLTIYQMSFKALTDLFGASVNRKRLRRFSMRIHGVVMRPYHLAARQIEDRSGRTNPQDLGKGHYKFTCS